MLSYRLLIPLSVFLAVPPAQADLTLVLGQSAEEGPTHQVHVKNGKVSVANALDKKLLVFDSASDSAVVVDHAKKEVTELSRDALERLVASMVDTRRRYLAGLEEKLDELSQKDQDRLSEVMDWLHLSTEPRGSAAPKSLDFQKTGGQVEVLGKAGEKAVVIQSGEPWGSAVVADRETLGISDGDFSALREFQQWVEDTTRGLPGEVQAQFGQVQLVTPTGDLLLQIQETVKTAEGGETTGLNLEVLRMDGESVEDGWFAIPEDFTRMSLYAVPKPEAGQAEKAENVSEK